MCILCCSIKPQPVDRPEAFQKGRTWCRHLWVLLLCRGPVEQAGFQTAVVVLVRVVLKVTLRRVECIECFQQQKCFFLFAALGQLFVPVNVVGNYCKINQTKVDFVLGTGEVIILMTSYFSWIIVLCETFKKDITASGIFRCQKWKRL